MGYLIILLGLVISAWIIHYSYNATEEQIWRSFHGVEEQSNYIV